MAKQTGSFKKFLNSLAKALGAVWNFIKKHREIIFLIVAIVLIVLAVFLVNNLVAKTFKHEFSCAHLIDETLNSNTLCKGVTFQIGKTHFDIFNLGLITFDVGPFPANPMTILPAFEPITGLLDPVRKFVVWNVIVTFAVVSLVLAFVASKVIAFVRLVLTSEGRKAILTSISLWLFIFVIFCSLFYFTVVVPSLGNIK